MYDAVLDSPPADRDFLLVKMVKKLRIDCRIGSVPSPDFGAMSVATRPRREGTNGGTFGIIVVVSDRTSGCVLVGLGFGGSGGGTSSSK